MQIKMSHNTACDISVFVREKPQTHGGTTSCAVQNCSLISYQYNLWKEKHGGLQWWVRLSPFHCPSLPCWWLDLVCGSTTEQLASLWCYLLTLRLQRPPFIQISSQVVSWVL